MFFNMQLIDNKGESWFLAKRELPSKQMLEMAEKRLPMLKEQTPDFAQGAIPAFGLELAKVIRKKSSEDEIDKAVIELALCILTVELYLGVSQEVLSHRNFDISVHDNGMVEINNI